MFQHFDLTLTAQAQRLSDVLPAGYQVPGKSLRAITLQADVGVESPIYVGGNSNVSPSSWAMRIPAPITDPVAPLILGEFSSSGPIRLSDFWVYGNDGVLHIGIIPF